MTYNCVEWDVKPYYTYTIPLLKCQLVKYDECHLALMPAIKILDDTFALDKVGCWTYLLTMSCLRDLAMCVTERGDDNI